MRPLRFATITLAGSVTAVSLAGVGPTSVLYLMSPQEYSGSGAYTTGLDRIQGSSVLSTTNTFNPYDYAPAVWGDVRTDGTFAGSSGSQFDLAGNMTNYSAYYNAGGPVGYIYDGTSDGKYNYAVDYLSGNVDQFDRNWNYQGVLFSLSLQSTYPWITMNAADGSFWLGNYSTGSIEHYTHGGGFLGSFSTGFGPGSEAGLAFDPADGTLWMSAFSTGRTLYQFSQGGVMLQSDTYALGGNYWYGMEFNAAPVPEPGTLAALSIGFLGILRRKRR